MGKIYRSLIVFGWKWDIADIVQAVAGTEKRIKSNYLLLKLSIKINLLQQENWILEIFNIPLNPPAR